MYVGISGVFKNFSIKILVANVSMVITAPIAEKLRNFLTVFNSLCVSVAEEGDNLPAYVFGHFLFHKWENGKAQAH